MKMALIIIISFLFIWGCGIQNKEKNSIKIGIALSLTGDGADYGKRSYNGIILAKELIENNNKIKFDLIFEDTRSDPKSAVNAITKLINQNNVKIIIGDIISGTTLAMAPIAERNKVLLFAPGASNPKMTYAGDYIFRNWTSDNYDGKVMANYCLDVNIKEIGLIYQQTEYTVGLIQAFKNVYIKSGGTVLIEESFVTGNTNLKPIIAKFKERKITSVFISAYSQGTGLILKQATEMDYKPKWFSSLTVEMPDCGLIAGSARNGVVFSTPAFSVTDASPVVKTFVDSYKNKFGIVPDSTAGHAYDALKLLSEITLEVGPEPDNIKKRLYRTKNYFGVTGKMSFDENGDVSKNIFIKEMRNDSSLLIKEIELK